MLTLDQAAERLEVAPSDMLRLVECGRAVGLLGRPLTMRLPAWQFDPPVWSALETLGRELGTRDGWALLGFLETPLGGLDGRMPRTAIEQADIERVMTLARDQRPSG